MEILGLLNRIFKVISMQKAYVVHLLIFHLKCYNKMVIFLIKGACAASDIYGMGCVLYELLESLPPFYNSDIRVMFENIRSNKLEF